MIAGKEDTNEVSSDSTSPASNDQKVETVIQKNNGEEIDAIQTVEIENTITEQVERIRVDS